jgi:hypothetical protein
MPYDVAGHHCAKDDRHCDDDPRARDTQTNKAGNQHEVILAPRRNHLMSDKWLALHIV